MPGKRHSEEQILYALRQVEAGKKVSEVCREMGVSQQARKTDPRTVHSFSDSTSLLSQNAGQVTLGSMATKNCLTIGVHSRWSKSEGTDFGIGGNALE